MPGIQDESRSCPGPEFSYRTSTGNNQAEESEGLRAVSHPAEIDQLNGLFWIKRLSRLKRERLIKRLKKAARSEPALAARLAAGCGRSSK